MTMAVEPVVCYILIQCRYIIIISSHAAIGQEDPLIIPNEELPGNFTKFNNSQYPIYAMLCDYLQKA
jgi:hypothetical protein